MLEDEQPGLDPDPIDEGTGERVVPSPAYQVRVGDRVGKLVAIEAIGTSPYGTLWRLQCDCGDKNTIRPAARINLARNAGSFSMCHQCLPTYRRYTSKAWKVRRILRRTWQHYGALYTPRMIERMTDAIREESELPEPVDLGERPFIASEILEAAKSNDYAMTLEEVGQELGVCRERVRQIEAAALAKLRKWFENQETVEITQQAAIARRRWQEQQPKPKLKAAEPTPVTEPKVVLEQGIPKGLHTTAQALKELRMTAMKFTYRRAKLGIEPTAFYECGGRWGKAPLWSTEPLAKVKAWQRSPAYVPTRREPLLTREEIEEIVGPDIPVVEDVYIVDYQPEEETPVEPPPTIVVRERAPVAAPTKRGKWVIRGTNLAELSSFLLEEDGKRVEMNDMDEAMAFAKAYRRPGHVFVAEFTKK